MLEDNEALKAALQEKGQLGLKIRGWAHLPATLHWCTRALVQQL